MRNATFILLAALCLLSGTARADVVEASSTTMLTGGQQTRDGVAGQKPKLIDVVPAYEIITVSARDIHNAAVDNLEVVLSTWGMWDLADKHWDNGTNGKLTGDVMTGYVKGQLLGRRLTLQVGREYVATGVAHMLQLDGGQAFVTLPLGIGISGYVGSPVSQRFEGRSAPIVVVDGRRVLGGPNPSWNPAGGDFAYGGRLSWTYPMAGTPGRGVEVGASASMVKDRGDTARNDVAVDARIQPVDLIALSGYAVWSLAEDGRLAEANALLTWTPFRKLRLSADYRRVAPDLLLSRTSILSVFADKERSLYGVGASYDLNRAFTVGADAYLTDEPSTKELGNKTYTGYEVAAKAAFHAGHTQAGAELTLLDAEENGYQGLRLFGRQDLGRAFVALDLLGHLFKEKVNGQDQAYTGTLSAGYELGAGWSAAVAGRAGVTAFMERQFDVMAKLVYNQTYRVREVR